MERENRYKCLLHPTRILLLKMLDNAIVYAARCLCRIRVRVLLRLLIIAPDMLTVRRSSLKVIPIVSFD